MFDNIHMYDLYMQTETEFNFIVDGTDELIELMDLVRKRAGMTDLFSKENDISYNFYFQCDLDNNSFELVGVCNYGEKDDWREYILQTTIEDKQKLMLEMIKALVKELNE